MIYDLNYIMDRHLIKYGKNADLIHVRRDFFLYISKYLIDGRYRGVEVVVSDIDDPYYYNDMVDSVVYITHEIDEFIRKYGIAPKILFCSENDFEQFNKIRPKAKKKGKFISIQYGDTLIVTSEGISKDLGKDIKIF